MLIFCNYKKIYIRPCQVNSQFIIRDIQKATWVGGHFLYFIVQLIALLEQSDCSIRVFQSEIPIMKFHAGVSKNMRVVTINCELTWPGLMYKIYVHYI